MTRFEIIDLDCPRQPRRIAEIISASSIQGNALKVLVVGADKDQANYFINRVICQNTDQDHRREDWEHDYELGMMTLPNNAGIAAFYGSSADIPSFFPDLVLLSCKLKCIPLQNCIEVIHKLNGYKESDIFKVPTVTQDQLVGYIETFPLEVVQKMVERQMNAGNPPNVLVFSKLGRFSGVESGGFDWKNTPEGEYFWDCVIRKRGWDIFFLQYPKGKKASDSIFKKKLPEPVFKKNQDMKTDYKVTQEQLVGEIYGFPLEVVQKMVERQVDAGYPPDVWIFAKDKHANQSYYGFRWSETPEGIDFWEAVINCRKWEVFFEKYPKVEENKTNQDMKTEQSVNGAPVEQKIVKYFKTREVNVTGLSRIVTIGVALKPNGHVSAGYSIIHPDDVAKFSADDKKKIAKDIAIGRALKPTSANTLLKRGEIILQGSVADKRFLLLAVADKLLADIEKGNITVKGIREVKEKTNKKVNE